VHSECASVGIVSSGEESQMQVRFARHTNRLAEVVRFYRDGLGLPELGRFEHHDGYDGVFLDLPGTDAHLEFTSGGGHAPPAPHEESLLVLYLGDEQTVAETCRRAGAEPVDAANPYWRRHGVTLLDPDGFPVVLVPRTWP
jgi:catechol 2,3-dioxygenase-like lactoylglutathione lyase family enzyme